MIKSIFKGVIYAVVLTLILVLVFAMVIKWANLDDTIIKPVMQVIKVLCIFMGTRITIKNATNMGWMYGGIVGMLYMMFTFIIFSLVDGNFVIGFMAINDLIFQTVAGVMSAFLIRMRNKDVQYV